MTITIDLPETEAEAIDMLDRIAKEAGYSWDNAKMMVTLFLAISENKKLFKALSCTKEAAKVPVATDPIKNCVKKGYMKSLAENVIFSSAECEKAHVARAFHANGRLPVDEGIRKTIRSTIKRTTGAIRSGVSYFKKTSLTRDFLVDYPNINADALVYLYLAQKIQPVKEDFEILRNFIELMGKEPLKQES